MRTMLRRPGALGLVLAFVFAAVPPLAAEEPPPMVARVAYVDGELLRYVPAEEDWVATVADSPMGSKDVFYTDRDGKAEFAFPNRTIARVGAATQVEVVGIDRDLTDLYVASGQVRLNNRGSGTYFRVTTPFGYVVAPPGAQADLYVGDESVEVISLGGTVEFVHTRGGSEAKYDVVAGESSLLADSQAVSSGEGTVDGDWDRWNGERDNLLAKRARVRSAQYLPEPLRDDAYDLDANGRWEQVQYEGSSRRMWRPTRVAAGWSPYTVGRWTTWEDEQVWVPYEPFGYVTHHYGNWVTVRGGWYWMPPVVSVTAGAPYPFVPWYPGRVAWIHSDADIGWVPLAPHEPYYGRHAWGPGVTVVVGGVAAAAITIGALAFLDHGVFVRHNDFWRGHDRRGYGGVRITNINKTIIINNYRATPVVNTTVLRNVNARQQYNFVDRDVTVKPHRSVVTQIKERKRLERPVAASAVTANLERAQKGQLVEGRRIQEPKITNKMVKAADADKPQVPFQEVKPKVKAEKPKVRAATGVERKPGRAERPEKAGKAGVTEKPAEVERPEKPEKSAQPQRKPKVEKPERPEQQQMERPAQEQPHQQQQQGEQPQKGKAKQKKEKEKEKEKEQQ